MEFQCTTGQCGWSQWLIEVLKIKQRVQENEKNNHFTIAGRCSFSQLFFCFCFLVSMRWIVFCLAIIRYGNLSNCLKTNTHEFDDVAHKLPNKHLKLSNDRDNGMGSRPNGNAMIRSDIYYVRKYALHLSIARFCRSVERKANGNIKQRPLNGAYKRRKPLARKMYSSSVRDQI